MNPIPADPPLPAGYDDWLARLSAHYGPEEIQLLRRALCSAIPAYAGQTEITGAPLLEHALGAADILLGMKLDHETLAATLLHALPTYRQDWREHLAAEFGPNVLRLVEGISRMEQIRQFSEMQRPPQGSKSQAAQIEGLRKMLLAMVEDIRVVLIKLAERTQTMRRLAQLPVPQQQQIARETHTLFAPLANRLGIWQLKWELEDLSLRFLEPELYRRIARLLDEKRADRESYIADVVGCLQKELGLAGLEAMVTGRPKHIYSIVNKMRRKGLDFSELYDVRAVRVLVGSVKDCYAALGVVHNLWQPIPGEFDDYIAKPKSNGYRSLHTAVIGPRGLSLEVQIRTHEMHQYSELGVAAHWRYKENSRADKRFDEKIAWLRQLLEWKEELAERGDLAEQFRNELFHDQVYVLTPQGKVIALPQGATPVDFAYAVHTELGHRTRGAKVDGNIVPLNHKLQNGQRVEILTAKQGTPSRDWLNPALGYLQSASARAKVRHWFRQQSLEEHIAQGRAQLERELNRLGLMGINQEKLAQRLHFNKLDELLAALGRGDLGTQQIATALQETLPTKTAALRSLTRQSGPQHSSDSILIAGMTNLQSKLAKCCQPAPPDAIVGYVTSEHGVTIHRQDCLSMLRLPEKRRDRLLTAQWNGQSEAHYATEIEIEAQDRQGLLRDISELLTHERINVTGVNMQSRDGMADMRFGIQIRDLAQLSGLLAKISQIRGVARVRRRNLGKH